MEKASQLVRQEVRRVGRAQEYCQGFKADRLAMAYPGLCMISIYDAVLHAPYSILHTYTVPETNYNLSQGVSPPRNCLVAICIQPEPLAMRLHPQSANPRAVGK